VLALILGVIYLQQELSQNGIMNINGALFVLLTNLSFRKEKFLAQQRRHFKSALKMPNIGQIRGTTLLCHF
jgi:hypothetical protein